MKSFLTLFLLISSFTLFSGVASAQEKMVTSLQVDYRIEIESGRDPKRPNYRPEPIVVFNRIYLYDGKAVYVDYDSTKTWSDYSLKQRTIIWKKGKNSYKYEYKDTNCCIMFSTLKQRYRTESTIVEEMILGRKTKKVIIYDDVNRKKYLVWSALNIPASVSPLGFLPVDGLVMRLRNENVVYEVVKINTIQIPESYFEVDSEKYQFSEKAFRRGVIE